MHVFNWAEAFHEGREFDDIPARVQRTEVRYWIWMGVSVFIGLLGLVLILTASPQQDVPKFIGLFLAIEGTVMAALIKTVTQVRLCMYWMLWDANQRLKRELRASEAADL